MIWLSIIAVWAWFCIATTDRPLASFFALGIIVPILAIVGAIVLVADWAINTSLWVLDCLTDAEDRLYGGNHD